MITYLFFKIVGNFIDSSINETQYPIIKLFCFVPIPNCTSIVSITITKPIKNNNIDDICLALFEYFIHYLSIALV